MMTDSQTLPAAVGIHVNAPAETLLFTQYRCWMAGYDTGDAACWDLAWQSLTDHIPELEAKVLYGEFHYFVRVLRGLARREIGWRPAACRCLCRDECLVLALVEASQRRDEDQERRCAAHVLGTADVAALTSASRSLAGALADVGLVLRPLLERAGGGDHGAEAARPVPRAVPGIVSKTVH